MPSSKEKKAKTIEFSPIGNGNEVTGRTPETKKDDSQAKRTSFLKRFATMMGMRPRDKEEISAGTSKNKTFGTISAITMEAGEGGERSTGSTEKTTSHSAGSIT